MTQSSASPEASVRWSSSRKVLFRFALLYFTLHILPYPLPRFDITSQLSSELYALTGSIVHAAGVRLLSLPHQRRTGGGDRADDYLGIVFELAIALAGAAVWSSVDRRRPNYRHLAYWATVALRYYVAYVMLEYGIIKLLKSQFPFPGPIRLLTPVGELTPMRLLWTLMGLSAPYTAFIGGCEFLGGCLLFFRRTVLTGALLTFVVLLNVFLMNLFYGVFVRLLSADLLLMTAILIAPDARRVLAVLLGRAVTARARARPRMSQRMTRALSAAKLVIVPGLLALAVKYGYGAWYRYGDAAPKPSLYGIWDVERFSRNGRPVDGNDGGRWQWLVIDANGRASLRRAEGESVKSVDVGVAIDGSARLLRLRLEPASPSSVSLRYAEPEPGLLELEGDLDGAPTLIRLRQRPLEQFPLAAHRFRWTSDLE